jgi:hypothetical protein
MMSNTGQASIPDLSRVTFFDGQRLAAEDLNAAATVQREFRWLHNRSLHNWGIGLGFAVSGAKGDKQVQVAPGYAIDCRGREIVLTESITKAVPARAGAADGGPLVYFLVAAYPDDASLTVLEERQGECGADGAVRLQERAAIYWKAQGEQTVVQGMEIVLAQATVQNCQLAAPLSTDQRRNARPNQQPYVAAGQSNPTPWTVWTVAGSPIIVPTTGIASSGNVVVGVQAVIDTSAGRFGSTPEYHAELRGARFLEANAGSFDNPQAFYLDGLAFLSDPKPASFTYNVIMPRAVTLLGGVPINIPWLFDDPDAHLRAVVRAFWSVVWVGVEG